MEQSKRRRHVADRAPGALSVLQGPLNLNPRGPGRKASVLRSSLQGGQQSEAMQGGTRACEHDSDEGPAPENVPNRARRLAAKPPEGRTEAVGLSAGAFRAHVRHPPPDLCHP